MQMTVDGEVIGQPKQKFIYLALWRSSRTTGWNVSGVFYYDAESPSVNLAPFNPIDIIVVRVDSASIMAADR